MADLGRWTGGSVGILPSTTWAAPNALFPTQARNDSSIYSFASSTSTLTLPSSGLADGYLVVGYFEFEDTSNGRHNPQGRLIQASGTGNFVAGASSGYNRDNSEDRAFVRTWAFIDSPSASATIQFQWRRDSDAPTGGTVNSALDVIPLHYSNVGLYESTSPACPGGTTPTQIIGWSVVTESDTAAIELASNEVTLKSDNKRYIALGSQYWQGIGGSRTQRWSGFREGGTLLDEARAYSYARNSSNADIGEVFSWVWDRSTSDIVIDQAVFRGEAVGSFPNTGADVSGNTTGSNSSHAWVVLELHDDAEVFRSVATSQQNMAAAGTVYDLAICPAMDFNDAGSFTRENNLSVNAEQSMDVLLGANVSGGYLSSSGARATAKAAFTVNGTRDTATEAGDYARGNQGSQDTWGWSANLLSFVAVSTDDGIGVDAGKIAGGEGGPVGSLAGWVGSWGLNLDSLDASTATTLTADAGSVTITGTAASLERGLSLPAATGAFAISGTNADLVYVGDITLAADAGSVAITGTDASLDYSGAPVRSFTKQEILNSTVRQTPYIWAGY